MMSVLLQHVEVTRVQTRGKGNVWTALIKALCEGHECAACRDFQGARATSGRLLHEEGRGLHLSGFVKSWSYSIGHFKEC